MRHVYRVALRFYEELNDFLPREQRKVQFSRTLSGTTSVKDVIEACGVPHTEVDLILINGHSVNFSYSVQPDDRISVYPMFEAFDISPMIRLRSTPLRNTRFVLDVHLGKLAVYLRFLGIDTLYENHYEDEELAQISANDQRILLTRDRGLLKRRIITHGYYVRETRPRRQLKEIIRRFQLFDKAFRLPRCTVCNTVLQTVAKAQIVERLLPNTQRYYHTYWLCRHCDKVYWQGSHYQNVRKWVQEIINQVKADFTFQVEYCQKI